MVDSKNLWPGWETTGILGRGSFGTVYEIERKLFNNKSEKAALKVISIPQNDIDIEEMVYDGYDKEAIASTFLSQRDRIFAEYAVMRKMNGNPNIVYLSDVRCVPHEDGIGWDIFIKMELLTPLIKTRPANYSEETVIKIARDLCTALITYEKFNVLHRGIKPQNIFLSEDGNYKLGEPSVSLIISQTMFGRVIGVDKFMAPEMYNSQPYDKRADIYSLGLVLYWLLNERRMPFMPLPPQMVTPDMDKQARVRRLSGDPLPMPAHGSTLLKEIALKACAYNPKDRYQSAQEILDVLAKEEPVPDVRVQMERKIHWDSGCFDEIDLVYSKAAEKEITARILSELEAGALAEARVHSSMILLHGHPITPEQYDGVPDNIKEQLIAALSNAGLVSFSATLTEPKIVVHLSPQFQQIRCCTAFSILNRLEKLDGSFNVLHPQATLEIQAPLGGKQGLVQIEMLISLLYPWLEIVEVSSNEVAASAIQAEFSPQQKTAVPVPASAQSKPSTNVVIHSQTSPNKSGTPDAGKDNKTRKKSPFAVLLLIVFLIIVVIMVSPNDPPIEFSPTVNAGKDVYADIVSIVPEYSISVNGVPHDIACKCITANDETVWVYMLIGEYIKCFDPAANFSGYFADFEELEFSSARRVYGRSSKAEDVCTGLSRRTGYEMLIRFSSDDEEKFNQNRE